MSKNSSSLFRKKDSHCIIKVNLSQSQTLIININNLIDYSQLIQNELIKNQDNSLSIKQLGKAILECSTKSCNILSNINNIQYFYDILNGESVPFTAETIYDFFKLSNFFGIDRILKFLQEICENKTDADEIISILIPNGKGPCDSEKEYFEDFLNRFHICEKMSDQLDKCIENPNFSKFPFSIIFKIFQNSSKTDSVSADKLLSFIKESPDDRLVLLLYLEPNKLSEDNKLDLFSKFHQFPLIANYQEVANQGSPTNGELLKSESEQIVKPVIKRSPKQSLKNKYTNLEENKDEELKSKQDNARKKDIFAQSYSPNKYKSMISTRSSNELFDDERNDSEKISDVTSNKKMNRNIDSTYHSYSLNKTENAKAQNKQLEEEDKNEFDAMTETELNKQKTRRIFSNSTRTLSSNEQKLNKNKLRSSSLSRIRTPSNTQFEEENERIDHRNPQKNQFKSNITDSRMASESEIHRQKPNHKQNPDFSKSNKNNGEMKRYEVRRSSASVPRKHHTSESESPSQPKPFLTKKNRERIKIFEQNEQIVKAGSYKDAYGIQHNISKDYIWSLQNTVTIRPNDHIYFDKYYESNKQYIWGKKEQDSFYDKILVSSESTFKAAMQSKSVSKKVCILNFASATQPGGGVLHGRNAQEECLSRQSTLYFTLKNQTEMYDYNKGNPSPYNSDYMIYSPNIIILRDDNDRLLDKPVKVSAISAAAVNCSEINSSSENDLIYQTMMKRCRRILHLCIKEQNDVIILGAFGCGVFKNPPEMVSKIFKKLIFDEFLGMYFKKIVFAIKGGSDQSDALITTFKNTFSKPINHHKYFNASYSYLYRSSPK